MKRGGQQLAWLVTLLLLALVAQRWLAINRDPPPHTPRPLPDFLVQGWVNTDTAPTRETLRGKWVVLDLWTTWCGPCRAESPKLVELHRSIAERDDVRLIGLNTDPDDTPEMIREYIAELPGYDWAVGHGAEAMPDLLDAPYLPTLILYGPDGMSVWRGHFAQELAEQLRERVGVGVGGADI